MEENENLFSVKNSKKSLKNCSFHSVPFQRNEREDVLMTQGDLLENCDSIINYISGK